MGATLRYVKEFDFGSPKVQVTGYCRGGPVKKMAAGGVAKGDKAQELEHASTLARISRQESAEAAKMKKGGPVLEKATGESYPSRKAMVKHETEETPRMQREELLQTSKVVAPARRSVPVAPLGPLVGMKKGGKACKS